VVRSCRIDLTPRPTPNGLSCLTVGYASPIPVILGLEPAQRMSVESMRVAFFLFVSFVFFLIIIGLLALGSVMSPVRWNERSKPAS
jgi:hypothetical protein